MKQRSKNRNRRREQERKKGRKEKTTRKTKQNKTKQNKTTTTTKTEQTKKGNNWYELSYYGITCITSQSRLVILLRDCVMGASKWRYCVSLECCVFDI